MIIVLMGVSGSGKTTIGGRLAEQMGVEFADADDFHSVANKQKMASGVALNDDDRQPWLVALNQLLRGWNAHGVGGVLACSALKAVYRETLSSGMDAEAVRFVLLDAPRELIAGRLAARQHEYMNASLLDSQLKTLEVPDGVLRVVNDRSVAEIVEMVVAGLGSRK